MQNIQVLDEASGWSGKIKEKVPGGSDGKESACNVGDLGSIPGMGRSPGEGGMATHSSILCVWKPVLIQDKETNYFNFSFIAV